MKSTLITLVAILVLFAPPKVSSAEDFYQWVSETGALEFTDDAKQIPAKYQDRATPRSWVEVFEKTEPRMTPVDTPVVPVLEATPVESDVDRNVAGMNDEDCDQPIRALPPRLVQNGDYSRFVYPYTDECGNVVAEMNSSPRVVLNR